MHKDKLTQTEPTVNTVDFSLRRYSDSKYHNHLVRIGHALLLLQTTPESECNDALRLLAESDLEAGATIKYKLRSVKRRVVSQAKTA